MYELSSTSHIKPVNLPKNLNGKKNCVLVSPPLLGAEDFSGKAGEIQKNYLEDGRISQTKDELRAQLYNAKTKDGLILFSNDDIEKIVGFG